MEGIRILLFSISPKFWTTFAFGHHAAFALTCVVQYVKNVSVGKCVSRFDFNRANVEDIIAHLSNMNCSAIFDGKNAEQCIVDNSAVSFLWFDKEPW
jgi:hypothetical protein